MAWRSGGTTNDEMVDNLKRFSVISSTCIERAFRRVDRKFFVPQEHEGIAHADQPIREGNVHISAPHMYGTALEALELTENTSMSFLNVGSGTGYMNCLVATILGPYSTSYGVEIHQDVIDHCESAMARWKAVYDGKLPHMKLIHGNALNISMNEGEALIGFDRIYIGASINRNSLFKLMCLLKARGVLIGPVGDELVKVVRIRRPADGGAHMNDFSQEVLGGVRFTDLLVAPHIVTVLPSRVWSPSVHQTYPESFRKSSKELLLCSHAPYLQPVRPENRPENHVNVAAILPRVLWLEILSYTHHNWFDPPQSDEALWQQRFLEEQENARQAQLARLEAEAQCMVARRERDVYRMLARRWQRRLQFLLNQQFSESGIDLDNEGANLLETAILRDQSDSDDESSVNNDMDTEASDDTELDEEASLDEEQEDESYIVLDDELPGLDSSETSVNTAIHSAESPGSALMSRPQLRTVSISEHD